MRMEYQPRYSVSLESTPSGSEYETELGNEIKEAYSTLIDMGGRPTSEIQLDPGLPDPIEIRKGLRHYATFWAAQSTFKDELHRWQKFRYHQQHARKRPRDFPAYCQSVHDYRKAHAIGGEIDLHLQWEQQTKLDEWKEYQYFQHRELAGRRAQIERQLEQAERQLETGQRSEGSALSQLRLARSALEGLDDLWEWVEQQLLQIASSTAISGLENRSNDHLQLDQSPPGQAAGHSTAQSPAMQDGPEDGPRRTKRISKVRKIIAADSIYLGPHASKVSKVVRRRVAQPRRNGSINSRSSLKGSTNSQRASPPSAVQQYVPRRSERVVESQKSLDDLPTPGSNIKAIDFSTAVRSKAKQHMVGKVDSASPAKPNGIIKRRSQKAAQNQNTKDKRHYGRSQLILERS